MKVLVAGATGVIGRQLVPLLSCAGHDVVGLARSAGGRPSGFERAGAELLAVDALDAAALRRAVRAAAPDAVVNMLTAIPSTLNPRRLARDFALTNRLRTEGTRNLLDAASQAGAHRLITQGLAYAYDPAGEGPADEDVPFWPDPPRQFRPNLDALRELERLTAQANGLVLRFGQLYGPGSAYAVDGFAVRQIRAGKMPIVGDGGATFSFTHAADAASAVVAALDKEVTGALNVVDDDLVRVRDWLPAVARMLHAPQPKHVPVALARLAAGGWGVAFMTQLRGADNSRARLRLNWRPRYGSWQQGFAAEPGVGRTPVAR